MKDPVSITLEACAKRTVRFVHVAERLSGARRPLGERRLDHSATAVSPS